MGHVDPGAVEDFMITIDQPEHAELRASVRKAVQRESPIASALSDAARPSGYNRALWQRLSTEIGIASLTIPEEFGGAGASVAEQAVVAEEFGRALVCSPALSTVGLAVPMLLQSGHPATQDEWLPRIAAGEVTAAVAYRNDQGDFSIGKAPVGAVRTSGGWALSGTARFVIDGHSADLLLVFADFTPSGAGLFLVRGETSGLQRQRMRSLDSTRALAELTFHDTPAHLLSSGVDAWNTLERGLDIATVLLAAEQQGGAETVLEMAVNYSRTRFQFGRAIASFQAIKHRCADLAIDIDRGRSALVHATWAASDPSGASWLGSAAATAALVCGKAYDRAAVENVQIHGGIGFTWEHSAHLYFRRAKSDLAVLAGESYYADRLLNSISAAE